MDANNPIARLLKADFADALGVMLGADSVSVAHVSKRVNAVHVLDVRTEALDGPDDSRDAQAADFLRRYGQERSLDGARVVVVLGRERTWIGDLILPAAAADNVANVVAFELDSILPLAADRLYHGHFVRPLGSAGEKIAVTVVGALREHVERAARVVEASGLPLGAATVEPLALADYFAAGATSAENDLGALISTSAGREFLTLVSAGRMISAHRFAPRGGREAELQRQLEASLPERSGDVARVLAEQPRAEGEGPLVAAAPEGFFAEGLIPTKDELAAVGGALGLLGETAVRLSLLPPELTRASEGLGLREIALSAMVVVMAASLFFVTTMKEMAIDSSLADELASLTPAVARVTEMEEKNRELLDRVRALEDSSRSDVLAYLREVTDLVPTTAYLTTFRYKGDRIEIDGIADKASGLIAVLEASPLFEGVDFTAPITKYLQNQERFSMRMRLEKR